MHCYNRFSWFSLVDTNRSKRVIGTSLLPLNTIRFFEITITISLVVYTRAFRSCATAVSRVRDLFYARPVTILVSPSVA